MPDSIENKTIKTPEIKQKKEAMTLEKLNSIELEIEKIWNRVNKKLKNLHKIDKDLDTLLSSLLIGQKTKSNLIWKISELRDATLILSSQINTRLLKKTIKKYAIKWVDIKQDKNKKNIYNLTYNGIIVWHQLWDKLDIHGLDIETDTKKILESFALTKNTHKKLIKDFEASKFSYEDLILNWNAELLSSIITHWSEIMEIESDEPFDKLKFEISEQLKNAWINIDNFTISLWSNSIQPYIAVRKDNKLLWKIITNTYTSGNGTIDFPERKEINDVRKNYDSLKKFLKRNESVSRQYIQDEIDYTKEIEVEEKYQQEKQEVLNKMNTLLDNI